MMRNKESVRGEGKPDGVLGRGRTGRMRNEGKL